MTLPELLLWFSSRLCTFSFFGAVRNLSIFYQQNTESNLEATRGLQILEASPTERKHKRSFLLCPTLLQRNSYGKTNPTTWDKIKWQDCGSLLVFNNESFFSRHIEGWRTATRRWQARRFHL